MTLGDKQRLFTNLLGKLIVWCYEQGYGLTLGEAYRPPETAQYYANKGVGIVNSLHIIKLAIDLNLFKDGNYLSTTEDHLPIGEYWESLHELCRWGGRFGDGNHYSLEHEGRK